MFSNYFRSPYVNFLRLLHFFMRNRLQLTKNNIPTFTFPGKYRSDNITIYL